MAICASRKMKKRPVYAVGRYTLSLKRQCYFSFEIYFSFSFYKFFGQSFLFLYYICISWTIISVLCSVDNIINLIRYVQESQPSPVYKNQNTNPVSFSTFQFSFKQARISSDLLILLLRPDVRKPQTEKIRSTYVLRWRWWQQVNELRILLLLLCPEVSASIGCVVPTLTALM